MTSLRDLVAQRYNFNQIEADIVQFRISNGLNARGQEINAYAHGLASAWIAYDRSAFEARQLGNWREYSDYWSSFIGTGTQNTRDAYRDIYNNQVGVYIGEYAKANNLSRSQIETLMIDAYNNGHMIFSINDPRIDRSFSGAPGDFVGDVRWRAPNENYQSAQPRMLDSNGWNWRSITTLLGIDGCFLPGTPILMADGTSKPIEDIRPGDEVASFDPHAQNGLGPLKPGKVTRTFTNVTKTIINLRGLKMTPGHVVLMDNGEWDKIAVALRDDRAIVEQRGDMAVLVRARTGAAIGSVQDIPIQVLFTDPLTRQTRIAKVRAGIPTLAQMIDKKTAKVITMADVLLMQDYKIEPDGTIICKQGRRYEATPWASEKETPYGLEMRDNWILALDGKPFVPEWIRTLPMEDEEVGQMVINGGGGSTRMVGTAQPLAKRPAPFLRLAAKNAANINSLRSRRR